MTLTILVILTVLAAILPIVGFARLLFRAQRGLRRAEAIVDERGGIGQTWGDLIQHDIREPYRVERNSLLWDILFVGVGLIAGGIAGVWSLLISVT